MKKTIAIALLALLAACTQPDHAKRVLEDQGYTKVEMLGYDWLNCSKDDTYHDKFRAVSPAGKPVTGVVCAGVLFKGATIRLD